MIKEVHNWLILLTIYLLKLCIQNEDPLIKHPSKWSLYFIYSFTYCQMWSLWKVISFYQPKWTCASAECIILFNPFDFVSMAFMVRESALKFELLPKHGGGKTRLAPEKRPKGCGHKRGPERQPFQPSVSNVVWNEAHQADVTSWAIDIRNEGIEKGKRANQLATTSCWLWSSYHLSRQRLDHKTTITSDVEETLHIHSS